MMIDSLPPATDPVLRPFIEAANDIERQGALETVLVELAQPIISGILGSIRGTRLGRTDVEDIAATVTVRLISQLQRIADGDAQPVESFGDFVARLTYNAVYDFLRTCFPERTRLKNRLRYVARTDKRFITTMHDGMTVIALSQWGVRNDLAPRPRMPPKILQQDDTAHALVGALTCIGAPALLEDLVTIFAEAWNVTDREVVAPEALTNTNPEQELATRSRLETLWNQIAALPARQRSALLLNLRDRNGLNALTLFVLVGIASIDVVAAAAGLTTEELWTIWDDLPLDDLTIAGMLGVTRQQVINLRKSARARLSRRMRGFL